MSVATEDVPDPYSMTEAMEEGEGREIHTANSVGCSRKEATLREILTSKIFNLLRILF
jgi:hypothetical protein